MNIDIKRHPQIKRDCQSVILRLTHSHLQSSNPIVRYSVTPLISFAQPLSLTQFGGDFYDHCTLAGRYDRQLSCPALPSLADIVVLLDAAPGRHWRAAAAMLLAATPGGGKQAAAVLQPLADERGPAGLFPSSYAWQSPAAVYATMLAAAHATVADVEVLWPMAKAALATRHASDKAPEETAKAACFVTLLGLACGREDMAIHTAAALAPLADGRNNAELLTAAAATGLASVFCLLLSQLGSPPLAKNTLLVALETPHGDGSAGLAALEVTPKETLTDIKSAGSMLHAAARSGRWTQVSAVLAACPKATMTRPTHEGLAQGDVPLVRWILQEAYPTAPLPVAGPVAWSSRGELVVVCPRPFLLALAALPECDRISPVAAAAAAKTPEAWAYLIVSLDSDARRVQHVYGDGTKLQHLVFSPDGTRLAAMQLPTDSKQAARVEVERRLSEMDPPDPLGYPDAVRPADLQPGEAEALEKALGLYWEHWYQQYCTSLPLPSSIYGHGKVAVYHCSAKCSGTTTLLWQASVRLPYVVSRSYATESAMLRPVWLQDGRELVVPTGAGGVGLVLDGHTGAEVEELEALDVQDFPKPHIVLHVADPDGRELWAVAAVQRGEVGDMDRDLILARRRCGVQDCDRDKVLWAVKDWAEISRGEALRAPGRSWSTGDNLLCQGEGSDSWIMASVDSRRGPDGVPRLLLSCGLGGIINTDTMRLDQHLPCFTGDNFTEEVVPAIQLSSDGRYAVGAQVTMDLVAGKAQPSGLRELGPWYSRDDGVEVFAISPDNKRVAFRDEYNGLYFSEEL